MKVSKVPYCIIEVMLFMNANMLQGPFTLPHLANHHNDGIAALSTALISEYTLNPLTVEICFGIPLSCYNLIYDTTSYYTYLCLDSCTMSQIGKPFNPSASKLNMLQDKEIDITASHGDAFGFGFESKDVISFRNAPLSDSQLVFIAMRDVYHPFLRGQADGVLGLHYQYSQLKHSFLHKLSLNKLISYAIFAHKFISPIEGKVYFGETGLDEALESEVRYCFVTLSNAHWECELHSMRLNGEAIYFKHNFNMIFSTGSYQVEFPKGIIESVLQKYKTLLKEYDCDLITEVKVTKLVCDSIPSNLDLLPSLEFEFENEMKISISRSDLFTYRLIDQRYELTLVANENRSKGKLGLVAMKQYHMVFNSGRRAIGAVINRDYIEINYPPRYVNIVLWLLFITLIIILLIVLSICRSITNKGKGKGDITIDQIKEISDFSRLLTYINTHM